MAAAFSGLVLFFDSSLSPSESCGVVLLLLSVASAPLVFFSHSGSGLSGSFLTSHLSLTLLSLLDKGGSEGLRLESVVVSHARSVSVGTAVGSEVTSEVGVTGLSDGSIDAGIGDVLESVGVTSGGELTSGWLGVGNMFAAVSSILGNTFDTSESGTLAEHDTTGLEPLNPGALCLDGRVECVNAFDPGE